jgi:hypothetical protein
MYIVYDEKTKKVQGNPSEKPFIAFTKGCVQAEVDSVPEKYDYLTVENIQEHSRVIKEAYEEVIEYDENGELLQEPLKVQHEKETEIYYTCDLIANFYTFSEEEIESRLQKKYHALTEKFIRERYSQSEMEAIINNYLEYKDTYENESALIEYQKMQAFRKECKGKAHKEVYGV